MYERKKKEKNDSWCSVKRGLRVRSNMGILGGNNMQFSDVTFFSDFLILIKKRKEKKKIFIEHDTLP